MARRHNFVLDLERRASICHLELSSGLENLRLYYIPSFAYGSLPEALLERWQEGMVDEPVALPTAAVEPGEIADRFVAKLVERRGRELAAGVTLYGPHRDDLRFLANGRDLRSFGSRGQQRTAALSLKLAEVEAMTEATGEAPLLLLDDVMSELDAQRRSMLLAALEGVQQAIITTTDWEDFSPEFRFAAQRFQVCAGSVRAVENNL
jgi:DNA replication and repair protein RecF